jgi:DNA-binding NarL/FixJ family response regulator
MKGKSAAVSRILLVDDEQSVLESTKLVISRDHELEVVGTASDCKSALAQTQRIAPELILMDLKLPGKSGIEVTQEIRSFNQRVKILVYSGYPGGAEHALAAGAQGFVLKGRSSKLLLQAIKSVLCGGVYIDEDTWEFLKWQFHRNRSDDWSLLNDEEHDLAPFLMQGLTSKEIAHKLRKKERRIEKIRANMMKKLHVKNAAALAAHLVYLVPEIFASL